ncbi:Glycoside Hydrolase Family 5 protein [Tuber magnatum]|uniref:Glycoside Hydrolase Family 5 protein n=1 Tax=Tuber magnatum TaxID=42249 RepID=A0A317SRJ6_9PEZI|nr:Glycoside Hydrolase Family 5 protein [Tuber magnatum]
MNSPYPPRPVVIPTSLPPSTLFDPSSISTHPSSNAFTDDHRRTILLRGINVSGDAKYPQTNPLAGTPEFYSADNVSYVGKPFGSAEEAMAWWRRLRGWGIGVVRMVVCWEALEPREMGKYDEEYIDYLRVILEKANEVGLLVFIDGHQDVWSRFTGGSGAPLWTFHLAGLDPSVFPTTCSAALDPAGTSSDHSTPSGRLWPTNYSKFGPATMFTLFFAGEIFAPLAIYEGPIQEFQAKNIGQVLRTAYVRAYSHLASRLRDLPNILGFDAMNEPHPGYIALPSLHRFNENTDLHLGYMPNALESMSLAAGIPTSIGYFSRSWPHPSRRSRSEVLNKECKSAWLPGRRDIWQGEGVFTIDDGKVKLGPRGDSYFTTNPRTSDRIDFEKDCYVPFLRSFMQSVGDAVKGYNAGRWMFIEPVPNLGPPVWGDGGAENPAEQSICYSPHWYDIRVLYEKGLWYGVTFDVLSLASGSRNLLKHTYFGREGLADNYATNFARFTSHLSTFRPSPSSRTPILIGETGIPFDMNRQNSYVTGNVHMQLSQLNAIFHGMEKSLLNWTVWNLTLSHSATATGADTPTANETGAAIQSGDGWNSEDFSLVSLYNPNTVEVPLEPSHFGPTNEGVPLTRARSFGNLYLGGRLLPALLRPYPAKTAGRLVSSHFLMDSKIFHMEFAGNASEKEIERTTEIFIPAYHFSGQRCLVKVSDGYVQEWVVNKPSMDAKTEGGVEWRWREEDQGMTVVHPISGGLITVEVRVLENAESSSFMENLVGGFV